MRPIFPFAFLPLLLAAGCSSQPQPPVKLYPVAGKVVYADGGSVERLERGKVWLQSKSDPTLKAVSVISDDGSFQMTTLFPDNKSFAGVPAGAYAVRIEPPLDDERQPLYRLLDPKYGDPTKSGLDATVPVEGELIFEVRPPARR